MKYLLIYTLLSAFSYQTFAKPNFKLNLGKQRNINLDYATKRDICMIFTNSLKSEEVCMTADNLTPEKLAVCTLYTSDIVTESICLKNSSLNVSEVFPCFANNEMVLAEQHCMLKTDDVTDINSLKSAITDLLSMPVVLYSGNEQPRYIFPEELEKLEL